MAIDNSSYNAIMREYENIRANNRAAQVRRIEEVYEKIPKMRELNSSTGSLAVSRYKESLKSGEFSSTDLKKDIDSIKYKKEELLKEAGFSTDYMDIRDRARRTLIIFHLSTMMIKIFCLHKILQMPNIWRV